MIRPEIARFVAALDRLPAGTTTGHAGGKAYVVTKSLFSNGRAVKLLAEERGGKDRISLNLYKLTGGPRLYPCEMPAEKALRFVLNFAPDNTPTGA